jgi:hypothetical protein
MRRWIPFALGCAFLLGVLFFYSRRPPKAPPVSLPPPTSPSPAAPVPPAPPAPAEKLSPSRPKPAAPKVAKPPVAKPKPSAPPAVPAPPTGPVPVVPPSPPAPPAESLEWRGNDSAVTHEGQVVIKNDRQWIHFWSEHRPHEAAPEVDFTRFMVVGVFSGPRPADQFAVTMVNVQSQPNAVVVEYQETHPPTGTLAVGVTVYPFHLKVIPRATAPVKFKKLGLNPS